MALFPQGLGNVDQRCNPGERRVLQQLKRCLEDDYIVWHDIPIGPRARQPDFVVLSPRWGILLLEVKDWKRSTLAGGTPDAVQLDTPRGRVTQAHPLRQARDVVHELVDLMRHDPALVHASGPFAGKLLFPYGWGVVLSHLRRADVAGSDFDELFPPMRTLLRDDLEADVEPMAFQHRLWGLFTVSYPHTLTLPQRDRIRWHLFPEVRLPRQGELALEAPVEPSAPDERAAGAGNLRAERSATPPLPDLLQVMDLYQEQVARSLGEGHRVIHGAAGSGKTMILIFRAQLLAAAARPESPILVMCFNRTLAQRIEALLRQRGVHERVQVRTFHSWCQDMARSYQLAVPDGLQGNDYFAALSATLARAVDSGRVPGGQYTALMIDEAHDFEDDWLRMAARMVSPASNSLLVLYDDAQSIYQARRRRFNFASVGIDARGRTSILKLNYRNTSEVLALAVHCAQQLLQPPGEPRADNELLLVQPASAGRHGPMPQLIEAANAQDEAEQLAERMAADWLAQATTAPGDLAVLCRSRALMRPIELALQRRRLHVQSMNAQAFRRFDWQRPGIKLLTMHSAKGLEFSRVYIAGLQALPMAGETMDDAVRLLYVAMTRSTHQLVLSAHGGAGSSALVERVRVALATVAGGAG